MKAIVISGVYKSFGTKNVLRDIGFKINKGEFVVLCGRNGCGKTTLLNLIAGIIKPDKGTISIDGKKPGEEKIGCVFQNYRDSLLPWKTNLENICFPLEIEGINIEKRLSRARDLVKKLDIDLPLSNYPYQSSGGEQQLVALLREIIAEPKVILMDEPFSALHYDSRNYLRLKVQEIWRKLGITIIFVSHDLVEAIQLGDRVFVIDSGKIARAFEIDLPRNRTEDTIFSQKFIDIRSKIMSSFGEKKW